jgi:uncharacterized RDD family membrane protein YckC
VIIFRLAAAAALDTALGILLAALLAVTTGRYFAARAAVTFAVGSPTSRWKGPIPMVMGDFGTLVYGIPFALILVSLAEPIAGATPCKRLFGLRIARVDGGEPGCARSGSAPCCAWPASG